MSPLNRKALQLDPKPDTRAETKYVADYLKYPVLIVLGDPGIGKTHLFKASAEFEIGKYFTAKQFTIYAKEDCHGQCVYIDGLDEKRSRLHHTDDIDEIIKR